MKKFALGLLAILRVVAAHAAEPAPGDWPNYGRTPGGDRIRRSRRSIARNVGKLTLAWEFKTGEAESRPATPPRSKPRRSSSTA